MLSITLREFGHSLVNLSSKGFCVLFIFGNLVLALVNGHPFVLVQLPVLVDFRFKPTGPSRNALVSGLRCLKAAELNLVRLSFCFLHNEFGGLPCFVDGRLFSSDGVPDLQTTFSNDRFERHFAVATASDGLGLVFVLLKLSRRSSSFLKCCDLSRLLSHLCLQIFNSLVSIRRGCNSSLGFGLGFWFW